MKEKIRNTLSLIPNKQISLLACTVLIVGLYVSRAMISIGMMMLFANALLQSNLKQHASSFFKQSHLVLLSGYFVLCASSYFWSEDKQFFIERIQIMLPFLVLPFAFHSMDTWDKKWFDYVFIIFIVLNLGGIAWSLMQYLKHKQDFDASYSFSHVIPTPFKSDHIRFSIAVVLSICFCVDLFSRYKKNIFRIFLAVAIGISIIYLHILSAKTGILVFYIIALLFILKLIASANYRTLGIALLLLALGLPSTMYFFSTSFRNKISYVEYSLVEIKNEKKQVNVSDEGRLISYGYALESIKQHPFIGVGLGDVYNEMDKKFHRDIPTFNTRALLPHNQFLMVGMAIGILGILYLIMLQVSLILLIPKNDFVYFSFWFIMFFTMMIEPLYETQYGACLFLFFLLLLLHRKKEASLF